MTVSRPEFSQDETRETISRLVVMIGKKKNSLAKRTFKKRHWQPGIKTKDLTLFILPISFLYLFDADMPGRTSILLHFQTSHAYFCFKAY